MREINAEALPAALREKWLKLLALLKQRENMLVAVSGGLDSSFLLYAAALALPERVFAITMNHVLMPKQEIGRAFATAKEMRTPWQSLAVDILRLPQVRENAVDRCYHCKKYLFTIICEAAAQKGLKTVAEGKNSDDAKVYRPGNKAALELGVFQPLFLAGLNKDDIRQLAKEAGLSFWSRPAAPCLATRFPYGTELSAEKLEQVEKGEEILRDLGFTEFRLRHHGELCRIEVPQAELPALLQKKPQLLQPLGSLGFAYVCADLNGFKSGGMDAHLGHEANDSHTD